MSKPQPKIAERRNEICKRVEKCTRNDLELLDKALDCLEYMRRAYRAGDDFECDPVRMERRFLLYTVLTAHDEGIPSMRSYCMDVERSVMRKIIAAKATRKEGKTA